MAKTTLLLIMALMAPGTGCGSSPAAQTGCVASELPGGANDVVCALGWSCDSGSEHYELTCTTTPGEQNLSCSCSSDQSTTPAPAPIMIPDGAFTCSGMVALPVVNQCGNWNLQM